MDIDDYCSIACKKTNPPLIGSVSPRNFQIFMDLPKPWPSPFLKSPLLPQGLIGIQAEAARANVNLSFLAFCGKDDPDPQQRRLLVGLKQGDQMAPFQFKNYMIPHDEVGEAVRKMIAGDAQALLVYEESWNRSEVFICTHGMHDACCGRFGSELVQTLRKDGVLVNECSHLGGHRFAPTMIEVPSMNCYGFLTPQIVQQILARSGDPMPILTKHYRGFLGLPQRLQWVEAEIFKTLGWAWLSTQQATFTESEAGLLVSTPVGKWIFKVQPGPEALYSSSCRDKSMSAQKTFQISHL